MKNDMTINQLAELVSNSFTEQKKHFDKQFALMEQRLDNHDGKFVSIEMKLTEHDKKFDDIGQKLSDHDEKLDRIVTTLDQHTHFLERLDQERLFTLEHVKRLEREINVIKVRLNIK
jgi:chromosome segregation ATPase